MLKVQLVKRKDIDAKMVWIKDINNTGKMGYYYGSVIQGSNDGETPLPENLTKSQ